MKVVFLSNYLTHHQVPFCEAMCGLVGEDNFRFISTVPMEQERLNMGWQLGNDAAYEIKAYAGEQQEQSHQGHNMIAIFFGVFPQIHKGKEEKQDK